MRFGQSVLARTSGEFLTLTADTSKFRCLAAAQGGHSKLPPFPLPHCRVRLTEDGGSGYLSCK